jgi:hypothetical protein
LKPYLKDLYKDLRLRVPKGFSGINKAIFTEYCRLPEVVANQIFDLAAGEGKEEINLEQYSDWIVKTFVASLNDRIEYSFRVFDFNHDN